MAPKVFQFIYSVKFCGLGSPLKHFPRREMFRSDISVSAHETNLNYNEIWHATMNLCVSKIDNLGSHISNARMCVVHSDPLLDRWAPFQTNIDFLRGKEMPTLFQLAGFSRTRCLLELQFTWEVSLQIFCDLSHIKFGRCALINLPWIHPLNSWTRFKWWE